jgi:O-antigen/teichoic acid export membrane protein
LVLLLYLTMPMTAALMAAGKQRIWTVAQFACVVLSAVIDPLLIPWFQNRTGNGGLGVCISAAAAEMLMVAAGLYLLPRDILQRSMWRGYASIAAAGAVMAAVALALSHLNPYAAAAPALLAYAACLWLTGGLDKSQFELLYSLMKRNRAAPAP